VDAYKLYPPVYWREGETGAIGSGILWLSQDVYENLARGGLSTFYFGIDDGDFRRMLALKAGSRIDAALKRLERSVVDAMERKRVDVYLSKVAPGTVDHRLIVNGEVAKVEAIKATSWFGEFLVMKNPYYPLVLKVETSKEVKDIFGTLFDYEVTELKDVLE
jgi:hypothetical protein